MMTIEECSLSLLTRIARSLERIAEALEKYDSKSTTNENTPIYS